MKRKLGVVATAVMLGGFVSTNAFAAGGGGPAGGQAGVTAGSAGLGALAVGRGGVGLSTGSVSEGPGVGAGPNKSRLDFFLQPFIIIQGGAALKINPALIFSSSHSFSLTPPSLFSVPLSTGASFSSFFST